MPLTIKFQAIRPPRKKPLMQPLRSKLDRFTRKTAEELMETVRRYPPPNYDSLYSRTNILYEGWDLTPHSSPDRVDWELVNPVHYANIVHGPNPVPDFPSRGWRNIEQVVAGYQRNGRFQVGAQEIITDIIASW